MAENTRLRSGDKITFDEVLYNKGQAYNSATGIFTVPVTGQYVIHASVVGSPRSSRKLDNFISIQLGWEWLGAVGVSNKESASVQAVYRLVEGRALWIKNVNDNVMFWDGTFSAALVQAE